MDAIEVVEAGPAELTELVAVHRALSLDSDPQLPPIGGEELAVELFDWPARKPRRTWLARLDGEPAGLAVVHLPQDVNADHVEAFVGVVPAARRRGTGRALLAAALDVAGGGRAVLEGWAEEGPGAAFCAWLGLPARQVERKSRLVVTEVDDALLASWRRGAASQEGYRIESWDGPYPDTLIDVICAASAAMDDMPRDELVHVVVPRTPDQLRDDERSVRRRAHRFGCVAIAPDGSGAGITELDVNRFRPAIAEQGDTGVLAPHRGRGLGRWLKAENLSRAWAASPRLELVTTWNAESNPWMLDINVAMGFRPHGRPSVAFQGSLDAARSVLARR